MAGEGQEMQLERSAGARNEGPCNLAKKLGLYSVGAEQRRGVSKRAA